MKEWLFFPLAHSALVFSVIFCIESAAAEISDETRRELAREGYFPRSTPLENEPGNNPINLQSPVVSRDWGSMGAGDAQYKQGLMSFFEHDYSAAIAAWKPLAEQGSADAQANLGWMYLNGLGVPADQARAAVWFQRAAAQGQIVAQNNLASCFENGWGVPQNYSEAARWYRQSADGGYRFAFHNLAQLLWHGQGVVQDRVEARRLFGMAAERGVEQAKLFLQNAK